MTEQTSAELGVTPELEPRETHVRKVIVCGPPHSGKSVFVAGMEAILPYHDFLTFRANPDGEGHWTYKSAVGREIRRKGDFDEHFTDWAVDSLRNLGKQSSLVLVDVGGKRTKENEAIFKECDSFVVVSSSDEELKIWQEFGQDNGLLCLALIKSDLEGENKVISGGIPLVAEVAGLERKELPIVTPVHEALAEILLSYMEINKNASTGYITIEELAESIGKKQVEREVAGGGKVTTFLWDSHELPLLQEKKLNKLAQNPPDGGRYVLDGKTPMWLAVAFISGIQPQHGALMDPKLGRPVDILPARIKGEGGGENLAFKRQEGPDFTVLDVNLEGKLFNIEALDSVFGPEVSQDKGVVISGRLPNWLMATLAMGYKDKVPFVANWLPGWGAVIAIDHTGRRLGEVIPESEVVKYHPDERVKAHAASD